MTGYNKRMIGRSLACLSVALLIGSKASAQWSLPDRPQHKALNLATEQFAQGHYAIAAQTAHHYLADSLSLVAGRPESHIEHAKYVAVLSSLRLNETKAGDQAKAFISGSGNDVYRQRTAYALAQYLFRHNSLKDAIPYYELAGYANLSNEEIVHARFELAYAYFNNKQFDKAATLFRSIREAEGKYNAAGNYYYALLAYNQGQYADALSSFKKIEDHPEYRNIVPYYIAELHYFSGNKKQALSDAQKLIKRKEKLFYHNELHLLAAQVLFEEQRYGEALPYFEEYYQNTDRVRKEDLYEMGYSYYKVNEWQNAIEKFKPLSSTRDTLAQTAMYLLGDCYLKTGDKKSARNAFGFCADMKFNPGQREAALFLSSKLSYELGYHPDAIANIKTLLLEFPNTKFRDPARTLLSDILIKTSNYDEAFSILQTVATKDELYWRVYQKVVYGYAIQQLQNGQIREADSLLTLSLTHPIDASYEAAAQFWKGEVAFRMQQYSEAFRYSEKFVDKMAANRQQIEWLAPDATVYHAYLNMGYASLEMDNFETAEAYFKKAQQPPYISATLAQNALLRQADAVFMQKDFKQALDLYDQVVTLAGPDAGYARYQKAIIYGITGNNNEKIALLQSLVNASPASPYADDARYELGLVYSQEGRYQQAINTLHPLTANAARSLAAKAWLGIAFAHQQSGNPEKAIDANKKVVENFPASEERKAALAALRSLYIETNQPAAYAALLKKHNLVTAGDPAIDSAYYSAAEAQFAAGRYQDALKGLDEYLNEYPQGLFTTKANYYKAETHYQLEQYDKALAAYEKVLNAPWSEYIESSARKAAGIAMDNKEHERAVGYFAMLRLAAMDQETLQQAYYGLMEANHLLGRKELAVAYADTLVSLPGVSERMQQTAQLYRARALHEAAQFDEALTLYQMLSASKSSGLAAEAGYQIAAIYLEQGQLKKAEEVANRNIRVSGSNDYWVVKSYILLADILTRQEDYFNAKATLQSIIKNAKFDDLKKDAMQKLERVKELEKKQSKLSD